MAQEEFLKNIEEDKNQELEDLKLEFEAFRDGIDVRIRNLIEEQLKPQITQFDPKRELGQFLTQFYAQITTLTDRATIPVVWNDGNVQQVTLGGNRTFTFSNPKAGAIYYLILKQDGTGSRTVTWPTIKWRGGSAPILTTTANKKDVIKLIYDGTDYLGDAFLNF